LELDDYAKPICELGRSWMDASRQMRDARHLASSAQGKEGARNVRPMHAVELKKGRIREDLS